MHGLRCSAACGIFLDQGSNPCPLHWQVDSEPLRHQGSPPNAILIFFFSIPDFFFRRSQHCLSKACLLCVSRTSLFGHPLCSINTAGSCLPRGNLVAGNWGSPLNWHFFPHAEKQHHAVCWELFVSSPSSLDSPFLGLRLTRDWP